MFSLGGGQRSFSAAFSLLRLANLIARDSCALANFSLSLLSVDHLYTFTLFFLSSYISLSLSFFFGLYL